MGAGEQRVILSGIIVPRGQVVTEQVDVAHTGGALALRFRASAGKTFLLNALEVLGPDGAELECSSPTRRATSCLRPPICWRPAATIPARPCARCASG